MRRRNEDDFDSPTAEGRQDNRFDLDDQRRDRPTTTVRQRLTTFLRPSLYLVVVVVVVLPLLRWHSPDLTLRSHQFPRTPLIFPFPGPLRSPATMSDPQHQPNPTAAVYALRYLRLLDILRDERATEPRLNTAEPAKWLNWAHAVRWLIVSRQCSFSSAPHSTFPSV